MNINEAIEQLKYYQNKPYVPTVRKVCDIALETIESQQQENEQLRAHVARMREALKQAGKAIYDLRYTLNYFKNKSGLKPYDNITQAQEALAEIDKAIGGKEDV